LRSKKDFAGDVSALWHSALKRFTHNAFCFTPPIHWRNIDEIYPFLNRCLDGFDRFLSGRLAPNASDATASKGERANGP
jgi:hypothetical protein